MFLKLDMTSCQFFTCSISSVDISPSNDSLLNRLNNCSASHSMSTFGPVCMSTPTYFLGFRLIISGLTVPLTLYDPISIISLLNISGFVMFCFTKFIQFSLHILYNKFYLNIFYQHVIMVDI